jgi:ATP-dependent DNA helicase RecQ
VVALTATAAPPVREEIVDRLQMREPAVLVRGFARPNIRLAVHSYFTAEEHKQDVLRHDVATAVEDRGRGIVYAATHHRVEALAESIGSHRVRVAAYHAGLPKATRSAVEHRFHEGELDVVVATIAFGMGIDKGDIRWVFHADVSGSLDEYYQELGRAGRDGEPAEATLYFRREDLALPRMYASGGGPSREEIDAVANALGQAGGSVRLADLATQAGLSRNRTEAVALALADTGGVALDPDGIVRIIGSISSSASRAVELVMARRAMERTRVDTMEAYAEHRGCRWKFVLEYFGEPAADRCGHCDNDERAEANSDEDHPGRPFARGSRVQHRVFGEGEVIGYVGSTILVAFDGAGYKRLDLGLVASGHLLDVAP